MKRRMLIVAVFLIAAGIALPIGAQESKEAQELKKKYPLLSRLDIPADSLPKGCTKPDVKPDAFARLCRQRLRQGRRTWRERWRRLCYPRGETEAGDQQSPGILDSVGRRRDVG